MYRNVKQGWYKLINAEKFQMPVDEFMKSYKDGYVNYKSSLELKAVRYCDSNPHIKKWSLEPFAIKYIKPTTGKYHRYYIDLVLEFSTGDKFLVEIKPYSQTLLPNIPKRKTRKSEFRYQKELQTYYINQAKWKYAEEFCKKNGFRFLILTEKELK